MPVNFTVHGPYSVPTKEIGKMIKGKKVCVRQLDVGARIWQNEPYSFFAGKKGCYVFANAVAKGSKPIYVGKTNSSFSVETFAQHKQTIVNDFLASVRRTGLQVYFIVAEGKGNCSEEIDSCETLLIQKSKDANKNLLNVRKLSKKFTITGIHGGSVQGAPTADVVNFRNCLNIKSSK